MPILLTPMAMPGPSSDIAATTSRRTTKRQRWGPAYTVTQAQQQVEPTPKTRPATWGVPPAGSVRLLPAVPETAVIFDLVEGRIEAAELVPDALDDGPHIAPIAVGPASGDETLIVQPVVDRPVCHVPTHVRNQQVDDVVFAEGEVEICVLPIGPAYVGS